MSVNLVNKRHIVTWTYTWYPMPFAHLTLRIECVACDYCCAFLTVPAQFLHRASYSIGKKDSDIAHNDLKKKCKMLQIHPAMHECKTVTGHHFTICSSELNPNECCSFQLKDFHGNEAFRFNAKHS